jgi:hypothetical protein
MIRSLAALGISPRSIGVLKAFDLIERLFRRGLVEVPVGACESRSFNTKGSLTEARLLRL